MFERASVRVIAGALLWSVALVFCGVYYHGQLFGVRPGYDDLSYTLPLIRSIVAGSFVGCFLGAAINAPRHPLWWNVGASAGAVSGAALSKAWPGLASIPGWPDWASGLALYFLFVVLCGVVAGILGSKKSRAPARDPEREG